MSWKGDYWGPSGALALAKVEFQESAQEPRDHISYASVKHSAAGRALAECKRGRVWYLWRGLSLGFQALSLVDQAWSTLKGQEMLLDDYDALDVSCAVWRRWGWMSGSKKELARLYLGAAKWKGVAYDDSVKPHTRAFLIVHAVSLGLDNTLAWHRKLQELAKAAEVEGERDQAGRIWKYIYDLSGSKVARVRALELAGSDQQTKMGC